MIEISNNTENDLIEQWVHRWGCSVSEAVLDPAFNIFRAPNIHGFIGYRIESGCAVTIGDPVCDISDRPDLALAFQAYCRERNLNVIYMIVSEHFAKWAMQNQCNVLIESGEELILDPQIDHKEGPRANRLRNKINHAVKEGVEVHEYLPLDEKLEQSIGQAAEKWLSRRSGPQIYLGPLNFFGNRTGKRWFYASNGEVILGAALLSRLDVRDGYLLKHLIVTPEAPRGTSELLLSFILETLRKENCSFVTYGIIPPSQLGETVGLGKITTCLAKGIFNAVTWMFNLKKRKEYWQQFQPKTEPLYLVFSNSHPSLQNVRAVMKVLNVELL